MTGKSASLKKYFNICLSDITSRLLHAETTTKHSIIKFSKKGSVENLMGPEVKVVSNTAILYYAVNAVTKKSAVMTLAWLKSLQESVYTKAKYCVQWTKVKFTKI